MKILTGEEIQTAAAEKLNIDFAALIALTAIWAPLEEHQADHDGQGTFARLPNCRRKQPSEPRGVVDGFIYYDNTRPNAQMKSMAQKHYGVSLEHFTVCHVWPETCNNERYHTCYANLVCIPAAIHSLTDFDAHVQACLQYRAYELFGWKPDEEETPTKPENYPTEWLELPRCVSSSCAGDHKKKDTKEDIVRDVRSVLESGVVGGQDLANLMNKGYCRDAFGLILFPLLSTNPNWWNRYNPVTIDNKVYYLNNQLSENNIQPLKDWLSNHTQELPIGQYAQTVVRKLLESGAVDEQEIKNLMRLGYCRNQFGLNFAMLSRERVYRNNVCRSYVTPLTIRGEVYYLTSQWYASNRKRLENWVARFHN